MIPLGYMMKRVAKREDWLKQPNVEDIFSASNCISKDFCDWINEWQHNGWWLFDSPKIIRDIARKQNIDLSEMTLFYYEAYEAQYNGDAKQWESFAPESGFPLNIEPPPHKVLQGYDVATYDVGPSTVPMAGHSPLSCNGLAKDIPTNSHCLLDDFQTAKTLLETGAFEHGEPGPYRIIAVYTLD